MSAKASDTPRAKGAFMFVLHSHLPYARLAGRWPHGEEWIHEAAVDTYIPLLQTLYDLVKDDVPFKLTIGITPTLAEQLSDSVVIDNLNTYLDAKIAAAQEDMRVFGSPRGNGNNKNDDQLQRDQHIYSLAEHYYHTYQRTKRAFNERFNRDIIGAFRDLQANGHIEIMASAATHAYLPLLSRDSSIKAQIRAGVASYRRVFGRNPHVFWLPECAYRPAYIEEDGRLRPGLESFLAEQGIKLTLSETHTITGGNPRGVAAGNAIGPYGEVSRRYVIPAARDLPQRQTTTYQAYYISDTAAGEAAQTHSNVAVIGRNADTGQQVWSSDTGYPGDFDYREFYKKSGTSGLPYWRVTGDDVPLDEKDYYHPDWAHFKIAQHAEHFSHLVSDLLREYHDKTGDYGLIAATYDTELFGHWWYEGVKWLGKTIRHIADNPQIDMLTASTYLEQHPPQSTLHIPESSWGAGGYHFTWDNGETHWMWQPIHTSEIRMEKLIQHVAQMGDNPPENVVKVMNQAARELMLMQSSDWMFHISTGQAREYAVQRFSQHVERFERLAQSIENNTPDVAFADEMWEVDKVFPNMDYNWFRP